MSKITEKEAEKRYDDYLDGFVVEDVTSYPTSYILKEVDPTAYNCGFADFCDAEGTEVFD